MWKPDSLVSLSAKPPISYQPEWLESFKCLLRDHWSLGTATASGECVFAAFSGDLFAILLFNGFLITERLIVDFFHEKKWGVGLHFFRSISKAADDPPKVL